MQRLLWALSLMLGSLGVFILYFVLVGPLSSGFSVHVAILIGAASAIVLGLSPSKDKGARPG